MGARNRIILGSRGSELALIQAKTVEAALRETWPEVEVVIEIIRTSGDEGRPRTPIADRKAGRKGMFTREIEKELLDRRVDVAVHSAKDLPSAPREELEIAATLPRANTNDVLITRQGFGLTSVIPGATIATGSIRRQRQLQWKRPDLRVVEVRGNVPTRIRKLEENSSWSGIILAQAGLERLGILVERTRDLPDADCRGPSTAGHIKSSDYSFASLSAEDFLPAGGQGIIALQVRCDDKSTKELLSAVDDQATHLCMRAEREFLRLLAGDCDSPVGVQARCSLGQLHLRAQVFAVDEAAPCVGNFSGADDKPEMVATKLMKQMYGE